MHGSGALHITDVTNASRTQLFNIHECLCRGLAKNTYGTGSFILLNTGTVAAVSRERMLTTIDWKRGDRPVEYAIEGALLLCLH